MTSLSWTDLSPGSTSSPSSEAKSRLSMQASVHSAASARGAEDCASSVTAIHIVQNDRHNIVEGFQSTIAAESLHTSLCLNMLRIEPLRVIVLQRRRTPTPVYCIIIHVGADCSMSKLNNTSHSVNNNSNVAYPSSC